MSKTKKIRASQKIVTDEDIPGFEAQRDKIHKLEREKESLHRRRMWTPYFKKLAELNEARERLDKIASPYTQKRLI